MTLGQRIKLILNEQKIKQIDFAKTLGISANYVNLIANDKKQTISDTLAKLIEETYGYSSEWVLNGVGDKLSRNDLTVEKNEILKKIQKMSNTEIKAVLAFVNTLDSMNIESKTIAELEEKYKKTVLHSASNTTSDASNIITGTGRKNRAVGGE